MIDLQLLPQALPTLLFGGVGLVLGYMQGKKARPITKYQSDEEIALAITAGMIAAGNEPDIAAGHAWHLGVPMYHQARKDYYKNLALIYGDPMAVEEHVIAAGQDGS